MAGSQNPETLEVLAIQSALEMQLFRIGKFKNTLWQRIPTITVVFTQPPRHPLEVRGGA